jgi:hypothetical protein
VSDSQDDLLVIHSLILMDLVLYVVLEIVHVHSHGQNILTCHGTLPLFSKKYTCSHFKTSFFSKINFNIILGWSPGFLLRCPVHLTFFDVHKILHIVWLLF